MEVCDAQPSNGHTVTTGAYVPSASLGACLPRSNSNTAGAISVESGATNFVHDTNASHGRLEDPLSVPSKARAPQIGRSPSETDGGSLLPAAVSANFNSKIPDFPSVGPHPCKRRTGRPLSYTGNPNSPHLTPEERRKVKRRISNRESARRIRDKQQAKLDSLSAEVCCLEDNKKDLYESAEQASYDKSELQHQLMRLQQVSQSMSQETASLQQESEQLQCMLEDDMSWLEGALIKQEAALEHKQSVPAPMLWEPSMSAACPSIDSKEDVPKLQELQMPGSSLEIACSMSDPSFFDCLLREAPLEFSANW